MDFEESLNKLNIEMRDYEANSICPPLETNSRLILVKRIEFLMLKLAQQQVEIENLIKLKEVKR